MPALQGVGSEIDVSGLRPVHLTVCVLFASFLLPMQRAQEDELTRIRKYYETSKEEDLKLLDKPEQ